MLSTMATTQRTLFVIDQITQLLNHFVVFTFKNGAQIKRFLAVLSG